MDQHIVVNSLGRKISPTSMQGIYIQQGYHSKPICNILIIRESFVQFNPAQYYISQETNTSTQCTTMDEQD